jgi:hypothetical protein
MHSEGPHVHDHDEHADGENHPGETPSPINQFAAEVQASDNLAVYFQNNPEHIKLNPHKNASAGKDKEHQLNEHKINLSDIHIDVREPVIVGHASNHPSVSHQVVSLEKQHQAHGDDDCPNSKT